MDEPAQNKTTIPWLRRPWFPESVFFFIVLWQESFRLSARTAHSVLPVSKPLQDFYYYNSGDFVNGYVMAFLLDGISNLIFFKKRKTLSVEGLRLTVQGSAVIASLLSAIVVIIYEMS